MTLQEPSRGEQTRLTILQAAHDLFIMQGYHGTSMRQIARQANIALGGLYNHFSSKEAVFEAVFQAFHPYHQILPLIQAARPAHFQGGGPLRRARFERGRKVPLHLGRRFDRYVQNGDRLLATIGCENGATSCGVLFRIDYQLPDGLVRDFWAFGEQYDGNTFVVELDLSPLAGQDVKFVLTILSLGDASRDRVLWVEPRIVRNVPAVTPTP